MKSNSLHLVFVVMLSLTITSLAGRQHIGPENEQVTKQRGHGSPQQSAHKHRHQHETDFESPYIDGDEDEFYDDYSSSRRELFQLTDQNGDGYVTREEYILQNGNASGVVDQIFIAYDSDGDGRFSEEEFLRNSSPVESHEECEEQIIQICDKLYLELRSSDLHSDETNCRIIQYLVDCAAGFNSECDITSYANTIATKAQSFIDSGTCPLLYLADLNIIAGSPIEDANERFVRSAEDVEIITMADTSVYDGQCMESNVNRCSQKFDKSITNHKASSKGWYCQILTRYGQCLTRYSKLCPVNVDDAPMRQSMARLKRVHSEHYCQN